MNQTEKWMNVALSLARFAGAKDEVPIGAIIVKENQVIATGCNQREADKQTSAHAEMIAIANACRSLDNWRLVKIGTTQAQRKLFFNLKKC